MSAARTTSKSPSSGCVSFQVTCSGSPNVCYDLATNLFEKERSMACPYCRSMTTTERSKKTQLGYRTFCCQTCKRTFNERTGTDFNFLEFPTDIVLLVVLWRLRYKLSLRDLAEMFLERGFEFTHEAVCNRCRTRLGGPLCTALNRATTLQASGQSW